MMVDNIKQLALDKVLTMNNAVNKLGYLCIDEKKSKELISIITRLIEGYYDK